MFRVLGVLCCSETNRSFVEPEVPLPFHLTRMEQVCLRPPTSMPSCHLRLHPAQLRCKPSALHPHVGLRTCRALVPISRL